MRKVVFATNNPAKLKELNAIFSDICGNGYQLLSLSDVGFTDEIEEDAETFEGNAYKKAKTVADYSGYAAIADDSGLEVDALNGEPGVYSARYAGEGASSDMLISKLLGNMDGVEGEKRSARFTSVMCAVLPGGKVIYRKGVCEGFILKEKKGTGGFGYDPVFYYKPFDKTFAEMTEGEKNAISHRAIASQELIKALHALSADDFSPANA